MNIPSNTPPRWQHDFSRGLGRDEPHLNRSTDLPTQEGILPTDGIWIWAVILPWSAEVEVLR
jgi:hypothetical protein